MKKTQQLAEEVHPPLHSSHFTLSPLLRASAMSAPPNPSRQGMRGVALHLSSHPQSSCIRAAPHAAHNPGQGTERLIFILPCFQVAGLAKELKRERLALSKMQQVPATQVTGDTMSRPKEGGMTSALSPPPAQLQAGSSLAGTTEGLKDVGMLAVPQPPPTPAAPAVAGQKVPAGGGAGEDGQAGTQLAQVGEDRPPQTEVQAAGEMTDAE